MTADRLRITSSRKSAIQNLARAVTCAALLVLPISAAAADLVVWWEKGFYPQEDEAVAEIVAAFEAGDRKANRARPARAGRAIRPSPGGARGQAAARLSVRY
jgi:hypothetical protein